MVPTTLASPPPPDAPTEYHSTPKGGRTWTVIVSSDLSVVHTPGHGGVASPTSVPTSIFGPASPTSADLPTHGTFVIGRAPPANHGVPVLPHMHSFSICGPLIENPGAMETGMCSAVWPWPGNSCMDVWFVHGGQCGCAIRLGSLVTYLRPNRDFQMPLISSTRAQSEPA